MTHTAQALVLHCMDFRFVKSIAHWLNERGLDGQYDDVSAAGGGKNLVDPSDPTDTDFILRQIEIAKKLHGITDVYLINHLDCGAYGKIFRDPTEERERHTRDLNKAKHLIDSRFMGLHMHTVIASLGENGRVNFEEIDPLTSIA